MKRLHSPPRHLRPPNPPHPRAYRNPQSHGAPSQIPHSRHNPMSRNRLHIAWKKALLQTHCTLVFRINGSYGLLIHWPHCESKTLQLRVVLGKRRSRTHPVVSGTQHSSLPFPPFWHPQRQQHSGSSYRWLSFPAGVNSCRNELAAASSLESRSQRAEPGSQH